MVYFFFLFYPSKHRDIASLDTENNVQRRKMMMAFWAAASLALFSFFCSSCSFVFSYPDIHLLQFITEYISYSDNFKETKLSFFFQHYVRAFNVFSHYFLNPPTLRESDWTTFWLIKAIWLRVKNNIKAFQVWEYKNQTDYEEVKKHWAVPSPPWQWMKGQKMERE